MVSRRGAARAVVSVLVCLLGLAVMPQAAAHALRVAHLDVHYQGDRAVTLQWRSTDGAATPTLVFGSACSVVAEARTEFVVQRLDCAGAATASALRLVGVPPDLPVVLAVRRGDEAARVRWLADAGSRSIQWSGDGRMLAEAIEYVRAGARHVLEGADHLLFLVALLVLSRTSRKLMAATLLFTLGHAASLVGVAAGHITVAPRLAELAIALTLVIAARAIAVAARARALDQPEARSITAMAAVFGFIHGLGFAGALEEVGLQAASAVTAVAAFNVGVELGQLAFIGALVLAAWPLRRLTQLREQVWPRFASLLIGTAGMFWCLERVQYS